jgi:pimeloyl-ACP methyl ester carboxylesterase
VPPFIRLLRSPLGGIVTRIPETRRLLGKQLTGLGHDASHAAGRRETGWARNERAMVRSIVERRGFVPGLVLTDAEIAGIEQPTLMVYGTADPIGSLDLWRRFVQLLPRGELEVVEGGGHLVWYDEPDRIGARVARFLAG